MMGSEQRARELLVQAFNVNDAKMHALMAEEGIAIDVPMEIALIAIRSALEQREAVPVAEVLGWNNDATPKLRINMKLHHLPAGTKLYATPPRDVPDGFVLVPRVPTEAMLTAGWGYNYRLETRLGHAKAERQYLDMLAAAPSGEVG